MVVQFQWSWFNFVSGILFFPLTFVIWLSVIWRFQKHGYLQSLPGHAVFDCANKATSAIFAVITCLTGSIVYLTCDQDVVHDRRHSVRHYMSFGVSYFLYDLVAMYLVFRSKERDDNLKKLDERTNSNLLTSLMAFCSKRRLMVAHHLVIPFVGFPIFTLYQHDKGDCLLALAFLMEASTPFVSLRTILVHLRLKSTFIYFVNGLAMMIVFFVCRILLIPYLYSVYASQMGKSLLEAILSLHAICNIGILILLLPQIYWFTVMCKGAYKLVVPNEMK